MRKALLITTSLFLVSGLAVYALCMAAWPAVVLPPRVIEASTPCPVAGCTQPDGACHANEAYLVPDGSFSMTCPRVSGCSDVSCHAFERIEASRSRPSDASLNLWIIAPVVLILGLVWVVRKL